MVIVAKSSGRFKDIVLKYQERLQSLQTSKENQLSSLKLIEKEIGLLEEFFLRNDKFSSEFIKELSDLKNELEDGNRLLAQREREEEYLNVVLDFLGSKS